MIDDELKINMNHVEFTGLSLIWIHIHFELLANRYNRFIT